MKLCTYNPQADTPLAHTKPTQLIAVSPLTPAEPPATPTPTTSPHNDRNTTCVAAQPISTDDSTATCVITQWHESAHTIINMESVRALEYHQILHHPLFKDTWADY